MNENLRPDGTSIPPWPNSEPRLPQAGSGLLNSAVRGAHDTLDRLADRAAPAVQQLDDGVRAAENALHARAGQLRHTRDAWLDDARTTVRGHPLTAVAAALALGAVIARFTR